MMLSIQQAIALAEQTVPEGREWLLLETDIYGLSVTPITNISVMDDEETTIRATNANLPKLKRYVPSDTLVLGIDEGAEIASVELPFFIDSHNPE